MGEQTDEQTSQPAGEQAGEQAGEEAGEQVDIAPVTATAPMRKLAWREAIELTVTGLGYDLVDVERAPRELLRVTIDRRAGHVYPGSEGEFVSVDDCEQVTRQLQYSLDVDGVDYERLEVSSPGLDRKLVREDDFTRFAGQEVSLTLKLPFQGRKNWRGALARAGQGWSLLIDDGKQVLNFALDELREARLVPVVDFKGRRGNKPTAAGQQPEARPGVDGGQDR